MKELVTVITRKGRLTVPAEVRKALDLKQGGKIAFELPDKVTGAVAIRRVGSIVDQTFGALASSSPAITPRRERDMFEEESAADVETETPPTHSQQ